MKTETVSISKGTGTDKFGVTVSMQIPETDAEWMTFWAKRVKDPTQDVNVLALQQYVIKAQGAARAGLDKSKADKGLSGDKGVQKRFNDYVYNAREAGESTGPKRVRQATISKKDLADPKALLRRLQEQGLFVVEEEGATA